jgi:hypothetical protein
MAILLLTASAAVPVRAEEPASGRDNPLCTSYWTVFQMMYGWYSTAVYLQDQNACDLDPDTPTCRALAFYEAYFGWMAQSYYSMMVNAGCIPGL